jgi:hypothetical protein
MEADNFLVRARLYAERTLKVPCLVCGQHTNSSRACLDTWTCRIWAAVSGSKNAWTFSSFHVPVSSKWRPRDRRRTCKPDPREYVRLLCCKNAMVFVLSILSWSKWRPKAWWSRKRMLHQYWYHHLLLISFALGKSRE